MSTKKQRSNAGENPVSRGRHEHQCRICSHPKRDEIEHAFIARVSPAQIAKKHSVSRDEVYRHANVLASHAERSRTERGILELS
jgi:hypothetical protein